MATWNENETHVMSELERASKFRHETVNTLNYISLRAEVAAQEAKGISETVHKIEHTLNGNGRPGIVARLAELEYKCGSLHAGMTWGAKVVLTAIISTSVGAMLTASYGIVKVSAIAEHISRVNAAPSPHSGSPTGK